jgi:PKD repeat protein
VKTKLRSALAVVGSFALAVSTVSVLTTAVSAGAAQPSDPGPGTLPSAVPSASTPSVDDGRVFAIAEIGNTIVMGGTFTSIGGTPRQSVATFYKSTGALVPGFNPTVDGEVDAVIAGPTPNTVYIGGTFKKVNGVNAKALALLNISDGSLVPSFRPPVFTNGGVNDLVLRSNELYVAGVFTAAGTDQRLGLASLNATTGALDPFLTVALTGHHNDTGSGAQSSVGGYDMDVTADGKTMVVTGNFKLADGQLRNQVALIDLSGPTAVLSPWSTSGYAPLCSNFAFDHYVRGVSFSQDGSFFVVSATGGPHAGTLCDAISRFETTNTPSSSATWVDESGGDTLWGITVTANAVYTGGHIRWMNNPKGGDSARAGAVPRPGMAALDVKTGRPYAWNPGHVPLGVSSFAFLATSDGVWMGYDEDYIGNRQYKRPKIAFFPYAGGYTPASTAINDLPGHLFLGGTATGTGNGLKSVAFDGATASSATVDSQGIDFANWRGAFMVGNSVYYGYTDNFLYSRTFDGTTFGPAVKVDPYNDPVWSDVIPYDGSPSLRGVVPTWYSQLRNVTGMTYYQGRVYYTLSGDSHLYSKWFLPDTSVIDETTRTQSSSINFNQADGMFVSGGFLYYSSKTDSSLRKVAFSDGNVSGSATLVSGPTRDGVNWSNRAMFLGQGVRPNAAPVASFTSQCTSWKCGFDSSLSSDSDGTIQSYAWNFGDGTTGSGVSPNHTYTANGTYSVTLTVTDNQNKASTPLSHSVTVTNAAPTAAFTSGCAALLCSFDGSGSSDSDGSVASYAWDFGDGSNGSGVSPKHTYGSAGTYTVTLTVTDDMATPSSPVLKAITTIAQQTSVQFVGAANAGGGNVTVKRVQIPSTAQAGDTALLYLSQNSTSTWTGPVGVTGWTQVDTFTSGTLVTTVWLKRLAAGDLGGTVEVDSAAFTHASLDVAVYRGVDATTPISAFAHAGDAGGTAHVTPTAPADGGDFVVSLWSDRSSSTVTWTPPAGQVSRDASPDSGSLTLQALVADGDGPATAGTAGGVTATTDVATGRAAMWTIVLNPSGATGPPPTNGVKFVAGANGGSGNVQVKQVQMPAAAHAGGTALMFLSQVATSTWTGPTGITGWSQVDAYTNNALLTTVWVKRLTAADLGATVRFDSTAFTHASLDLVVYSGVDATTPIAAFQHSGDAGVSSHVTPTATAGDGDFPVSFWGLRATATRTWAAPSDTVIRDQSTDPGSNTVEALVVDGDQAVAAGQVGGLTATTDDVTTRTSMWTIVLNAA